MSRFASFGILFSTISIGHTTTPVGASLLAMGVNENASTLDKRVVLGIFATLRELASTGMTIFLVEQNANHALKLSDRAYVMVNGEIRLSGTGKELLVNDEVRNAYLGGH